MTGDVSYSRQLSIFDPMRFTKKVDVIGAGALGSHIVYTLAKMGVRNITAYDFDTVASHNVSNQLYRVKDIDRPKVDALKDLIRELADIEIDVRNMKVEPPPEDGPEPEGYKPFSPGEIVIVAVDSMRGRKEIYGMLKRSLCKLMIEARMGGDSARIYTIIPGRPSHQDAYEQTLYDDSEAEVSLCGSSVSVACTAIEVSAQCVWQMIKYVNNKQYDNEIVYGLSPLCMGVQTTFR